MSDFDEAAKLDANRTVSTPEPFKGSPQEKASRDARTEEWVIKGSIVAEDLLEIGRAHV